MRTVLIIVLFIFGVSITAQTEEVHTGYTDNPRGKRHVVALQTGQTLDAAASATSGNLDVVLYLQNSLSQNVAESDDPNTADAALTYTAESDGQYIVLVASANGTYGDYALTLSVTEAAPQTAPHNNTAPDTPAHLGVRPEEADQIYTGYMAASSDPGIYPVWLDAGQAVIATASKSSGNLDTVLTIYDAEGNAIAENDNRDASTLNAEVVYVAEETGEYIIVLTSLGDTYGDFRVEVAFTMGGWMEEFVRTPIQGEEQIYDTPSFRIHYALDGADATTMEYVRDVALAMEEVRLVQISTIGWPMPPQDSGLGGDNRYDVYLTDVLDEMQGMLGYAAPELPAGDNPSTPNRIETNAAASHLVLDNDFLEDIAGENPIPLIVRRVAAHEFSHAIQFSFDLRDAHTWYYEATATWVQTQVLPDDPSPVEWLQYLLPYPETCFGADQMADPNYGMMMYGMWTFLESITDVHGTAVVTNMWDNIATYEGFDSLKEALQPRGDTLQKAVARWHIQNLLRNYTMGDHFGDLTVPLAGAITAAGDWSPSYGGVEELGASFYEVQLPPASYDFQVNNNLETWLIGISGDQASAYWMSGKGAVHLDGTFDHTYLMVFNPVYDNNVNDCIARQYIVTITETASPPGTPVFTMDAGHFLPPQ